MKRLLLLLPLALVTACSNSRELISYACIYPDEGHTSEKVLNTFQEDWSKGFDEYVPWTFEKKTGDNYLYKAFDNSFSYAESTTPNQDEVFEYETTLDGNTFKARQTNYEVNTFGKRSLSQQSTFEFDMDTMTETWSVSYPKDYRDPEVNGNCIFIPLPEGVKINWKS